MDTTYIAGQGEKFKTISVEITSGSVVTTYIGLAPYASVNDKFLKVAGYSSALDMARPIRRIKKVIEDGATTPGTVVTETLKPDASDEHKFIRNDYLTLNYV